MTIKEIASQFEELQMELWQIKGIAEAVNVAIVEGGSTVEAYEGALYALSIMTYETEKKSKELLEAMFQILREEL